ncbi:MAG: PucR family transcriptional regulator, purine catabolism regulatory protein [Solirubrobacteraceae bacterium]|nr:PucR family transcriptional regulator, purine catabolism regulatory protein [Solirubrobacteraceae bacterium]
MSQRAAGPLNDNQHMGPDGVRFTVADALALPVLRRGLPEIAAGRRHLDRPIRWVHACEMPNIADSLTGGELLLATGMGIGARPADQRRFVAELAERRTAALIIELGSAMAELPPALVGAAEAAGLPLIGLRREVFFVEVTEAIHTEIVSAQYAILRRGEEIGRRLTALMLDGEGIPAVLRALAETLGNPVFLESADGRLISHAAPAGDVDPLEVWAATRATGESNGAGAREPGEGMLAAPVPMGAHQPAGALVAIQALGDMQPVATVALERAAGIVALGMLRARQEEELLFRERGNLLVDLAEGRLAPVDAARRAESLGLPAGGGPLLPLAAEVGVPEGVGAAEWGMVVRRAQADLRGHGLQSLLGVWPGRSRLLVVIALRDADQRAAVAELAAAAIRAAVARLGSMDVAVAVGRTAAWDEAGPALRLAAEAAAAAANLPAAPWHDVTALELPRLLWRARHDEELTGFVERTLGALLDHDARRKLRLVPTLEALLRNGGRKAETARALHLNRQALYHRLTRIEQLLGVDLGDATQLLALHVALEARRQLAVAGRPAARSAA